MHYYMYYVQSGILTEIKEICAILLYNNLYMQSQNNLIATSKRNIPQCHTFRSVVVLQLAEVLHEGQWHHVEAGGRDLHTTVINLLSLRGGEGHQDTTHMTSHIRLP